MDSTTAMLAFALLPLTALGCGGCSSPEPEPQAGSESQPEPDPEPDLVPASCAIGGEMPKDAAQLLARIDELGRPLSLPCLLASLPRPLSLVATDSIFSVQPAVGRESPRVFVLGEDMVFSIALAGEGRELLEFGEWHSSTQTLKGELVFPVEGELSLAQAYVGTDKISTRCATCHRNEEPSQAIEGAYFSDAIRPKSNSIVSLEDLEAEHQKCDPEQDRLRCELLSALFDFGAVEQGAFDEHIPTFF